MSEVENAICISALPPFQTTTGSADKSLARPTSDLFCLMVRIFRLMLVLFYIYI